MCRITLSNQQFKLLKPYGVEKVPGSMSVNLPPIKLRTIITELRDVENEKHSPLFWRGLYDPTMDLLVDAHNRELIRLCRA